MLLYLAEWRVHTYFIKKGAVEERLKKRNHSAIMLHNAGSKWLLHENPKSRAFLDQELILFDNALRSLSNSCGHRQLSFTLCTKALLESGYGCNNKARHERFIIDDAIYVFLAKSFIGKKFTDGYIKESGSPMFFYYQQFLQDTKWNSMGSCQALQTDGL